MGLINRFVKGFIGVLIVSGAFAVLMLPIDTFVFGIETKGDIGLGIGIFASIIGGVIGWVFLSKSKWLTILAVFIVVFIMSEFLMDKYPEVYSVESYTFTSNVDGVSVETSRSDAKYSDGLLRVFTVLKGEDKGIIIIIISS